MKKSLNTLENNEKKNMNIALKKSIENRQKILDIISKNQTENGYTYISQNEIGEKINLSQTKVNQILKDLIKDNMIEKIDKGIYKVLHNNMKENEEYKKIFFLINYFITKPEDYYLNEEILSKNLNIERSVIQKTKAYLK